MMRTLCSRRILHDFVMHVYFQKVSTEWFEVNTRSLHTQFERNDVIINPNTYILICLH
jgi:hypothetical protein